MAWILRTYSPCGVLYRNFSQISQRKMKDLDRHVSDVLKHIRLLGVLARVRIFFCSLAREITFNQREHIYLQVSCNDNQKAA